MGIKEQLEELDFDALITIWNEYCDNTGDCDSRVGCNEDYEINDIFCGMTSIEILRMADYGGYHYSDDYYAFDGNGNLVSFNGYLDEDNCPIDIDELADWLEDNPDIAAEHNLNIEEEEDDDE